MTDSSLPPPASGAPSARAEGARDDDVGAPRQAQDMLTLLPLRSRGRQRRQWITRRRRKGWPATCGGIPAGARHDRTWRTCAIAVPGKWFSSARPLAWPAHELQVTRGVGPSCRRRAPRDAQRSIRHRRRFGSHALLVPRSGVGRVGRDRRPRRRSGIAVVAQRLQAGCTEHAGPVGDHRPTAPRDS